MLKAKLFGSFGLFVILFLPLRVLAIDMQCCICTAGGVKTEFCALTTDTMGCGPATDEMNTNTGGTYNISCEPLDMANCHKASTKASARCAGNPVLYENINKKYLDDYLKTYKKQEEEAKKTEAKKADEVRTTTGTAPVLGVPLPGVTFPEKLEIKNNYIQIPYLATYLIAFHKYLIGLGLVAAAVMLVYAGFKYIISSTGAHVKDAKDIIKDALMGLAIILCSVVILANINPSTTQFGGMKVKVVGRENMPEDTQAAKDDVNNAAKIQWNFEGHTVNESDYLDPEGEVSLVYKPKVGQIAESDDMKLPVAQRTCPANMIPIVYSKEYTRPDPNSRKPVPKDVPSFCIDKFEAPNIADGKTKPYYGVLGIEAAWWCDKFNKRLCAWDEWERACLGPEGKNTFGYGPVFSAGKFYRINPKGAKTGNEEDVGGEAKCNYDSQAAPDFNKWMGIRDKIIGPVFGRFYPLAPDGSIIAPVEQNTAMAYPPYKEGYYKLIEFLDGINAPVAPSGSHPRCVTAEGVFDMPGNVQEIVLKEANARETIAQLEQHAGFEKGVYGWINFYWSPAAHQANLSALPTCSIGWGGHNLAWRAFENGFRCCMDLELPEEKVWRDELKAEKKAVEDEAAARANAKRKRLDICGTTKLTEGASCIKLSKTDKQGKEPGQFTCYKGYCMAAKSHALTCCRKNE